MSDSKAAVVHRLHDMTVEEVSVVDRAANRRKFLLVKRHDMAIGAPVLARPDGSYTATGGGGSAPAPNANAAAPAASAAPRAKAAISLTSEAQSALMGVLENAASMLSDATDMVKGATEVSTDPEDGESMDAVGLTDVLTQMMGEVEDALYAVFGVDEAPAEEGAPAPETGPTEAGPVAANAPPLAKRLAVMRAKRVIAKADAEATAYSLLRKYGARMAKDRFQNFQNALQTLLTIAGEIAPATVDKARAKAKAKEDEAAKGAKGKPAVTKRDEAPTGDVTQHPAFIALQKQFKEQTEVLTDLRKTRAVSNAAPMSGLPVPAAPAVSWPLDMNDDRFKDETDPNHFGH